MTKQELIEYCLSLPGVLQDYPVKPPWTVMQHEGNEKGFAFIVEKDGRQLVNLKCEPMEAEFLRAAYEDVIPGYSMNKTHWNTVMLDGDVPDEELKRQIGRSFDLTKPRVKAKC
ncbi:MAG: MmcQ/YjbR family DNA-binding protein [Christensenellaceae bacterium]|jgi:predicted DNA-binding protein (MmcQ/YjbR family)|nr:MmcQ/YjbR family DNA-binding protein [Christensenellaceae bacterium]